MRKIIFGLILSVCGTSALAQEFGHTRKDHAAMNHAFNDMAEMCARDLGFSRVPKKPDAVLVDKMEADLLLATSYDYEIQNWAGMVRDAHAMDRASEDDAFAKRLADCLVAATKDPDSYARAEERFVEYFKEPVNTIVVACRRATFDPFLGANYVTGDGSAERYDGKLRAMFAEDVKTLQQDK